MRNVLLGLVLLAVCGLLISLLSGCGFHRGGGATQQNQQTMFTEELVVDDRNTMTYRRVGQASSVGTGTSLTEQWIRIRDGRVYTRSGQMDKEPDGIIATSRDGSIGAAVINKKRE